MQFYNIFEIDKYFIKIKIIIYKIDDNSNYIMQVNLFQKLKEK